MIMLDLQKVFDTVVHTILCDQLVAVGVEPVPSWHGLDPSFPKEISSYK